MSLYDLAALLKDMKHSAVHNYIIPGLTSTAIGGGEHGMVRAFWSERDHQERVTPHSHRYSFVCLVVQGTVRNTLWRESSQFGQGDMYEVTTLKYNDEIGDLSPQPNPQHMRFRPKTTEYHAGELYGMHSKQIHSIEFAKDTIVLFFEGPTVSDESLIIEPVVNGRVHRTFKTEPWMFQREDSL